MPDKKTKRKQSVNEGKRKRKNVGGFLTGGAVNKRNHSKRKHSVSGGRSAYDSVIESVMRKLGGLMSGGYAVRGGERKQKVEGIVRHKRSTKKRGGELVGGVRHKQSNTGRNNNSWIRFLKKWSAEKGISYAEALADKTARRAYHNLY